MGIKDIVNRDVVNIDNCESEPIHVPGSIQPHGFLLAIDKNTHVILYCSANVRDFLDREPKDVLGKRFHDLFDCEDELKLENYAAGNEFNDSRPFQCHYNKVGYNTLVHLSGELLILEFEPHPEKMPELPNLYIQMQKFVNELQRTTTLKELCQSISEEIRHVTGYDRVMIYRFDKDYNGEVFAEAKRDDLEGFLGLHYPHTDIPVQARMLYLQNPLRIIADVDYTPSPIYTTVEGADHQSLHLGNAILRSVSPIHIEYLKNMGVGATLTISLINDGKLWGLVACHHYSKKELPHFLRHTALLEGNFLSSQIKVREASEKFELSKEIDGRLQEVLNVFNSTENIEEYIRHHVLSALVDADGFAIVYNGRLYSQGIVPPEEELLKLIRFLHSYNKPELITDNLIAVYPNAREIVQYAAGLMFFSINKLKNDCVIWFRTEIEKTINWAGEPDKAIIKDQKGLSPRKSFASWKQIVKEHSRIWEDIEINAAIKCVFALQKQFTIIDARKEEEKQRKLTEQLQAVNEELSNLNWIGSHDLKEPLRKIQVFASRMLDKERYSLADGTTDLIERIRRSAERMQLLIDDILRYTRLSNVENHFSEIDLNLLMQEVMIDLDNAIEEKNAVIEIGPLPVIKGILFQVRQLFINLVGNAIKFSRPDEACVIKINSAEVSIDGQDHYKITVSDNGIGFDKKYEDAVFKVFQRLNDASVYQGTGIGLAICKKIMEIHHGSIEAASVEGVGAEFSVYFPVNS
ncbi:MAG: hypothetical protein BGO70_09265 [Bacteroidetes bacterium 43-93]|nr:GAF domain-containing protein [Bacteroidota bacterium]OJX00352.1 MAG: hypothetical protein BGO70_09265 [Bacteroidetes bacterium 43-93]